MQTPANHHGASGKQITRWVAVILILLILFIFIGRMVDGGNVSDIEKRVFVLINHLPSMLQYPMILAQYSGLLFVPIIASVFAIRYKKYALAFLFALIIPAKIIAEKVIKANYQRERPKVYIDEAILRGDVQASGLSFTSGHAIIIFALVTLATPFVSRSIRIILWAIAIACIFARVYLGAHLPLDVIGGALVGMCIGLLLLITHELIKLLTIQIKKQTTATKNIDENS